MQSFKKTTLGLGLTATLLLTLSQPLYADACRGGCGTRSPKCSAPPTQTQQKKTSGQKPKREGKVYQWNAQGFKEAQKDLEQQFNENVKLAKRDIQDGKITKQETESFFGSAENWSMQAPSSATVQYFTANPQAAQQFRQNGFTLNELQQSANWTVTFPGPLQGMAQDTWTAGVLQGSAEYAQQTGAISGSDYADLGATLTYPHYTAGYQDVGRAANEQWGGGVPANVDLTGSLPNGQASGQTGGQNRVLSWYDTANYGDLTIGEGYGAAANSANGANAANGADSGFRVGSDYDVGSSTQYGNAANSANGADSGFSVGSGYDVGSSTQYGADTGADIDSGVRSPYTTETDETFTLPAETTNGVTFGSAVDLDPSGSEVWGTGPIYTLKEKRDSMAPNDVTFVRIDGVGYYMDREDLDTLITVAENPGNPNNAADLYNLGTDWGPLSIPAYYNYPQTQAQEAYSTYQFNPNVQLEF